ncbi:MULTISPECIES: hypothetical protein [unclassified Mesorhizobium]|uniref:hypothetical protein n=1 Tax=unclassified Mesorhizobium TaxID=325217 RepID=UPI0024158F90|nr:MULTISPECIES: hypothetical protein [unclassified Mesorhizobium]MDG4855268.1 hypothetical protein [Mesorhizobium sp. WSM4982]MDG4913839.1 hypothetical protein [Mesorhizobium sp. WSM4983]
MKPDHTKTDEKRFNETLKRMLKTPPKAHADQTKKGGDKAPPPSKPKKTRPTK